MKRTCNVLMCLIFILGVFGCAGLQVQNQNDAYYKALGIWYDAGSQFKFYYENVDPATREKWDEEFRPLLIKAKDVLDFWNMHLQNGESTGSDVESWKQMKNEILFYLATQIQKRE